MAGGATARNAGAAGTSSNSAEPPPIPAAGNASKPKNKYVDIITLTAGRPNITEAMIRNAVASFKVVDFIEVSNKPTDLTFGITLEHNGSHELYMVSMKYSPLYAKNHVEAWANHYGDTDIADRILRHQGCVIISHIVNNYATRGNYDRMGTILAAILPSDALLLHSTENHGMHIPHAETAELLRTDTLAAFPSVTPPSGSGRDAIEEAIEEARTRFPEFLTAWQARARDGMYMIKCRFTEGDRSEHMWVMCKEVTAETVTGTLENSPAFIRTVKKGQTVSMPIQELSDWVYTTSDAAAGAFTDPSMQAMIAMISSKKKR